MHLIRRSKQSTLMERIKESLNAIRGAFAYLIFTPDAMIEDLDPNGFRPLSIGQLDIWGICLVESNLRAKSCRCDIRPFRPARRNRHCK